MFEVKIIKCKDPALSYSHRVGQIVSCHGIWEESGYAYRDDGGYTNFIAFEDAELVSTDFILK